MVVSEVARAGGIVGREQRGMVGREGWLGGRKS